MTGKLPVLAGISAYAFIDENRAGATCHVPFCTMSGVNNNNVNECHIGTVQWCRKGISGKGEYGVINENKSTQV